jgi:hypothetical protein
MSTIKVNTLDSTTGTSITVPTGKTFVVTDAGALSIGGVAITTGAQGVLSKTTAYTIVAADFTGKSSLIVFVDVSAGTSTETIITLPAAADFGTCAIHVVSSATHGAGNYITIKNSSAVEQYSLYFKGDHCEFVSDATNIFRTGNEYATVWGDLAFTATYNIGATVSADMIAGATSSNYTITNNFGNGWKTATDDFIAPHAGLYRFGGHVATGAGSYISGWFLKKNGDWVNSGAYAASGNMSYTVFSLSEFPLSLAAGDSITFWCSNHSGTHGTLGNASATGDRTTAAAWMIRRY